MAFRSISAVVNSTSGASATPASPPGVQENDHILLFGVVDSGAGFTPVLPPEFTPLLLGAVSTPDGQGCVIGWKRATASEPATYTISPGVTADLTAWTMAFSGRSTRNQPQWTQTLNSSSNASPVSIGAAGITALASDDLLWIAIADQNALNIGTSFTPPGSYTERLDSVNQGAAGFNSQSIATQDNVAAGTTGTVTGTFILASGTAGFIAFLFRLPASEAQGADAELTTLKRQAAPKLQQRM